MVTVVCWLDGLLLHYECKIKYVSPALIQIEFVIKLSPKNKWNKPCEMPS